MPTTIHITDKGNQNISGIKTFATGVIMSGNLQVSGTGIFNSLDLNNIDNLSLSGVDVTITSGVVNLTNPLSAPNIVYNTGNQTISGVKTFHSRPTVNSTGFLLSGDNITSSLLSPVTISSGTNGNFSNLNGLTVQSSEWWNGVPTGWSGLNSSFTVYSGIGTNNYVANVATLSIGPSGNSFRQNLGRLPITSDVKLTFTFSEPFNNATLNAAIYDGAYNDLATGQYTSPGTYTLTSNSIPANTNIIIGFWSDLANPALDNVSFSQTTRANTIIFPVDLPRNNDTLPNGGIWVDTSAGNVLKIKL